MAMLQVAHDPVLSALGISATDATQSMTGCEGMPYDNSCVETMQAWSQAMTDWQNQVQVLQQVQLQAQLQQVMWQAQLQVAAAAACATPPPPAPPADATPVGLQLSTPRVGEQSLESMMETEPLKIEATPTKALVSEVSTELGSPSNCSGSEEEQETEAAARATKELRSNLGLPLSPTSAKKLSLHAILYENAKDPASKHLLELIKGADKDAVDAGSQEKGRELLALLQEAEPGSEPRLGPRASGARRRAAVAAREAAAKAALEEQNKDTDKDEAPRRRRPRGGRGSRGGRGR